MLLQKRNKGFTLYELTIVIALVAIISTLLVSFIIFLSDYQEKIKKYNDEMSEIYTYRALMEKWFSYFDMKDYTFVVSEGNLTAQIAEKTPDTYGVTLSTDNTIVFQYDINSSYGTTTTSGDYNILETSAEYISSLTFSVCDTANTLYKCVVGCESGDISFLLERHVV